VLEEEPIRSVLMLVPCDIFPPVHGAGAAAYFTVKHLLRKQRLNVLLNHAYSLRQKADLVHPNLNIKYCRETTLDAHGFKGVVFNPFYLKASLDFATTCDCDVIQCELLWPVLTGVLLKRRFSRPLVLVDRNVEYLKFRQIGRGLSSIFVRTIEKTGCDRADRIVVVSEVDKDQLMTLYGVPEEKVRVIPNCADTDVFRFSEEGRRDTRELLGVGAETTVLTFVGKLDYAPNTLAVRHIVKRILPAVVRDSPDSVFLVVGGYREPLLKYRRGNLIFTGYVGNLSSYLSASDIVIVPLDSGSGTRLKILEAASCSRAIVSTKKGAEGLDFVDKREILLSENVDAKFIGSILELVRDQEFRDTLGKNARKKIEQQYSWGEEIRRFEEMYAEMESGMM
jgi:glycosyltransferase involved in cell wall biosynthesis